jgi:hypothetical protein
MRSVGSRALAAGKTWVSRTDTAPWGPRWGHTSVVDAAGAIYVLGGEDDGASSTAFKNDVYVSIDGGARTRLARVLWGTTGYSGAGRGTTGVLWGY